MKITDAGGVAKALIIRGHHTDYLSQWQACPSPRPKPWARNGLKRMDDEREAPLWGLLRE